VLVVDDHLTEATPSRLKGSVSLSRQGERIRGGAEWKSAKKWKKLT
jgi:hypothetical protein